VKCVHRRQQNARRADETLPCAHPGCAEGVVGLELRVLVPTWTEDGHVRETEDVYRRLQTGPGRYCWILQ
jgi:hypothetical protein